MNDGDHVRYEPSFRSKNLDRNDHIEMIKFQKLQSFAYNIDWFYPKFNESPKNKQQWNKESFFWTFLSIFSSKYYLYLMYYIVWLSLYFSSSKNLPRRRHSCAYVDTFLKLENKHRRMTRSGTELNLAKEKIYCLKLWFAIFRSSSLSLDLRLMWISPIADFFANRYHFIYCEYLFSRSCSVRLTYLYYLKNSSSQMIQR